jgi:hypothetical protein
MLITWGLGIAFIGIITGGLSIWSSDTVVFPSGTYAACFGCILSIVGFIRCYWCGESPWRISPVGCGLTLLTVVLSSWLIFPYNFYQGPSIRGEILVCSLLFFALYRRRGAQILSYAVPVLLGIIVISFLTYTNGRLLVSDDHGSFIYRLVALVREFPHIPFYSTIWNGGFDARDFFATGSLNFFFLTAPLLYTLDIFTHYTAIQAIPLFILLPCSLYAAARLLGALPQSARITTLLGVCSTLLLYKWGLKYGTLGFITSLSLFPLLFALTAQCLTAPETYTARRGALLVIVTTLTVLWSGIILALIPCGIVALISLPTLLKHPRIRACIVALVALNLPWVIIFVTVSKVGSFIKSEKPSYDQMALQSTDAATVPQREPSTTSNASLPLTHKGSAKKITAERALSTIRSWAFSSNPLLLLFMIPGIAFIPKRIRPLWYAQAGWLFILGVIVAPLKPQLELDRMLLLLSIFSALPAGAALSAFLSSEYNRASLLKNITVSLCGGVLLLAPLVSSSIVMNRSLEQYSLADSLTADIERAIAETPNEGRILFSGFLLHEVDGGHVAYLAYKTGRRLMASSQFHNVWRYKQIFPKYYLEKPHGIEEYMTFYNVSHVFAHEKEWRDIFKAHPHLYEEVTHLNKFSLFKRKTFSSSWVVRGSISSLEDRESSLIVTPQTEEVVLKFNYLPFLESSSCQISGETVAPEITLIRLSHCTPGSTVTIRSVNAFKRVGASLWQ